ncbi:MAG: apolipoprotein N-acyltransferase [Ignavibacteriales bacterium]|nr:apolipoprotein N-acyltransferase [Ignavibacteriales bacterium]
MAVLSGVMLAMSLPGYDIFPAAFVALVPMFFALSNASLKKSFLLAFLTGLTTGLIYYTWSIESSLRYAETISASNILVYMGLSVYHSLWFSFIGLSQHVAKKIFNTSTWKQILFFAALVVCIEWTYQNIFPSYPWIIILPYTQATNLWLLQWTSFGGMWLLTFIVAVFNALIFFALKEKSKNVAFAGIGMLIGLHIIGYVVFVNARHSSGSTVNVAILQENIDANSRWDDAFVDSLAQTLLALNAQAAEKNPQLIIWSETAIPWTFQTDDDLLNEALRITHNSGATHLVGMLTPADNRGNVFNSIYCIEKDGRTVGRYDKAELLSFLEKPFVNWQMPFEQSRYSNVIPGTRSNIVQTRYTQIGTMICNESLSPYAAATAASRNAQMLVVSSNDSWFYGSMLVDAHVALSRMRAVETRKDIAINANRGFGGMIRASGELEIQPPSGTPRVISGTMHLNSATTFAARFPDAMFYCAIIILIITLIQSKSLITNKRGNP